MNYFLHFVFVDPVFYSNFQVLILSCYSFILESLDGIKKPFLIEIYRLATAVVFRLDTLTVL